MGSFNYFNLSCTIGHDTVLGDFNLINPGVNISGGVKINNKVLLGTGSKILEYKSICSNCIIGASSLITKSLDIAGVYIGIPAKIIE